MSYIRKFNKTVYATVAAVSFLASVFSGSMLEDKGGSYMPSEEFYRQPYSSLVFDYNLPKVGASKFADISEADWFYGYVDTLTLAGVINGKSENLYAPSGTLTLPECSALIVRCLGLEEKAAEEKTALSAFSLPGFDKWYIGHIKLCIDAGIIPADAYGFGYNGNGNFLMTSDYFESVPVKRYELAYYIYRMTMLDGSGVVAKSTYTERGGFGHEFIRSGFYDFEAAEKYGSIISDYSEIPEHYRQAVLACYYNGIFNGDEKGNFNPNGSITRAEIAKVISVLTDTSKRLGEDFRENAYVLSEQDYTKDMYGNKRLTKDAGHRILLQSASSVSFDGVSLRIPLYGNAPMGYIPEVYVYEESGGSASLVCEINGNSEGYFNSGGSVDVFPSQGKRIIITYVLRNIANGGDVEGIANVSFDGENLVIDDGISEFSGEALIVFEKDLSK